jgi:hypothetical protein
MYRWMVGAEMAWNGLKMLKEAIRWLGTGSEMSL